MKIGSLELQGNVFLAPMAGITDAPFRRIVEDFGVAALWTEMISAHGLLASPDRFKKMLLGGREIPTIFQISGYDPAVMAYAAQSLQDMGAAAIDINMGCPARKIVHKGAGAALMQNLPLAEKIVSAVRGAVKIPVTTKIRSGWSEQSKNAPTLARIAEDSGADAVIVHSRCYWSKHSGPVSLQVIREVKRAIHIPVIGNGGIQSVADAEAMIAQTDCDGIMVGRGALGRPWLLSLIMERFSCSTQSLGTLPTVLDVIRNHFKLTLELWPVVDAVRRMRKHLGWYSKGFINGTEFRQEVFREEDPVRVLDHVEKFFGRATIT